MFQANINFSWKVFGQCTSIIVIHHFILNIKKICQVFNFRINVRIVDPDLELGILTKWLPRPSTVDRETAGSCDQASCMLRHHVGVTTVERPDPKGLSTFSQCTEFPPHSNSCPQDLELVALTNWLASRC